MDTGASSLLMQDPDWGRLDERIDIARIDELAQRVQAQNPEVAANLAQIAQLRLENLQPGCQVVRACPG